MLMELLKQSISVAEFGVLIILGALWEIWLMLRGTSPYTFKWEYLSSAQRWRCRVGILLRILIKGCIIGFLYHAAIVVYLFTK